MGGDCSFATRATVTTRIDVEHVVLEQLHYCTITCLLLAYRLLVHSSVVLEQLHYCTITCCSRTVTLLYYNLLIACLQITRSLLYRCLLTEQSAECWTSIFFSDHHQSAWFSNIRRLVNAHARARAHTHAHII